MALESECFRYESGTPPLSVKPIATGVLTHTKYKSPHFHLFTHVPIIVGDTSKKMVTALVFC